MMNEKKEKTHVWKYVSIISKLFFAFFIVATGVAVIPLIVDISREGSLMPLFYSISILISAIWIVGGVLPIVVIK